LKTVKVLVCESCDQPILKPECGVIVQGNIYRASLNERLPLIGDNFSAIDRESVMAMTDLIREVAFCKLCFIRALGWQEKPADPNAVKIQWPGLACHGTL